MSWIEDYKRDNRLKGQCLCGAVEITVDGPHYAAIGVCHCGKCQKSSGFTFGAFVAMKDSVSVAGEVATYRSTSFSSRSFCPKCGSNLWLRNDGESDYELYPGLFPDAAAFPLVSEIYTDRRPAYVPLAGDHRTKTQAEYEAKNPHVEGDTP